MTALPSRMTDSKRVSGWSSGQWPRVQHSPSEPGQVTASSSKKGLALTLLIFLIMLTFHNISAPSILYKRSGLGKKKKSQRSPSATKTLRERLVLPCSFLPHRKRFRVGLAAYKQTQRCKLKGHTLGLENPHFKGGFHYLLAFLLKSQV